VLPGTERPVLVIKIEDRRDADEFHVGFVVGVQVPTSRSRGRPWRFIHEVVSKDAVLRMMRGRMSLPKSWLDLGSSESARRMGISRCV